MAATNRTDKIKQLHKSLQKRYKHVPKHAERGLLECLMFAACLENASFDAAESAYSVLEHHYIDWNELRVSTPQEIGDTLRMLPQPVEAGERIKKTLQWIFETTYVFSLEEYRKKTIGQMTDYLDSIPSCTPFMTNYLVQVGLGGHQIPLDEGALRIMRRLDLTKVNNGKEEVSGLERAIAKNKGVEFATLMHVIGVDFFDKQDDAELLTLLKGVDKNAPDRSWQEPEGVQKKADIKPPIFTRPPLPVEKGFQPEIELDDEEDGVIDPDQQEDAIEFIDTGLATLGAGGGKDKDAGENGESGTSKGKKEPKAAKTKTAAVTEKTETKPAKEPAGKADVSKKNKPAAKSTSKKATEDKSAKKTKDKPAAAGKSTVKKSTPTKKTASKKETKKPEPKAAKKTSTKSTPKKAAKKPEPKKSDNKSATKKLQQKKPR